MEKRDIFDKLMALPGLRILEPFYKAHKEVLLYLFFGGLAFIVSVGSFALASGAGINEHISNLISWVLAVLFAFVTNRIWVFHAPTRTAGEFLRQMGAFFGGRVATLLVEEAILAVFITWLKLPAVAVKVAAQVVVIVLNYVVSKVFVFKRRDSHG